MNVYQVWFETSVGPTFSSLECAIEYVRGGDNNLSNEDILNPQHGYPDIRKIVVDPNPKDARLMDR